MCWLSFPLSNYIYIYIYPCDSPTIYTAFTHPVIPHHSSLLLSARLQTGQGDWRHWYSWWTPHPIGSLSWQGIYKSTHTPCATYMHHFIWFTIIDIKAGVHLTECNWLYLLIHALNIIHTLSQTYHCSSNSDQTLKNRNLPHMPLCISMISGVCMLGMKWTG